jgi:hypothetical protein
VPQPSLTVQERRLAAFCRVLAFLYFAGALLWALPPGSASLEAPSGAVLAAAMMTAVATACLIASARPRERRHAVLPAAVAQLTAGVLAAAHLIAGHGGATLAAVAAINLPLFVLTAVAYRSAAPGVQGEAVREAPPPEAEEPPKIQLKVSKS